MKLPRFFRRRRRRALAGRRKMFRRFRRTGKVGYRKRAGELGRRARKWTAKLKRSLSSAPGFPFWGGGRRVIYERADPIARRHGLRGTSGKRRALFGNPGSDHYVGNRYSFAKDWARGGSVAAQQAAYEAAAREIREEYTPGEAHVDYEHFYFTDHGWRYRGQLIAAQHGTGPHLHHGVERIGRA